MGDPIALQNEARRVTPTFREAEWDVIEIQATGWTSDWSREQR